MNERLSDTTVAEAPPLELLGFRALVTGGTRGIGAAIAATLARRGANVVISARAPADELPDGLKELEEAGVLERRVLPRPAGSVVYELTDHGRGLQDAVLSLARWGTKTIGEPGPSDVINPSAFALGLRSAFHPEAARGLTATYEVNFGNAVVNLHVDDGALDAHEGPADEPDLKIATDALPALLRGDLSPAEAEHTDAVHLTGDARLLEPFTAIFRLD